MFFTFSDLDRSLQEEIRQILMPENEVREIILDVLSDVKSRLKHKYETLVIFKQEGDERNRDLLTQVRNMVTYRIYTKTPLRVMPQHVTDLYNDSLKWFEIVGLPSDDAGCVINPDLPLRQFTTREAFKGGQSAKYTNKF